LYSSPIAGECVMLLEYVFEMMGLFSCGTSQVERLKEDFN
jgi:hypothetical protein